MIQRRNSDAGFTLLELIVVIVILGVIILPMGNLVIEYFTSTNSTQDRFSDSHDVQIVSAYLARDVQSAGMRDYSTTPPSLTPQQSVWNSSFPVGACGSTVGALKLLIGSDDFSSVTSNYKDATAPTHIFVAYVLGSTDNQLYRVRCQGASVTGVRQSLTHNLAVGTLAATCDDSSCGPAFPNKITLSFNIQGFADNPVTITGQRRQANS
jgi:prepilin-type N-terminal cleavage/methylation domain-containing protein